MNLVSVVIPIYQETLNKFEVIALEQCFKILRNYEIKFICPKYLENTNFHFLQKKRADFVFLNDENFKSIASYNHMMLSPWFYKMFVDYKYILIYQLDCFVFQDNLVFWTEQKYSYLGAPWFKENSGDFNEEKFEFDGVGNGGLSLRNVKDCLMVLKSNRKIKSLKDCIFIQNNKYNYWLIIKGINRYLKKHSFKSIKYDSTTNEDKVFSSASKRFKGFNIPSPEVASQFSFEVNPDLLYKQNNNQLPFGCHAWHKYNLEFYIPFLSEYGYKL
ncbi:MAG: hypothetical protein GZ091_17855 [Paludibacter sp.]|uniref:DUF5672 domain-containing protein n=1 Tax=Flavobacterium frigoris TaxID=229204 RepID=A0A1H9QYP1_FLAFI|nr:DUF5672 family protein [Flavobacterium frigoris]NDP22921.1 hypothetical protein [Paludibacter sp.]SER65582.1 hypothetical protein SAMN05444355_11843 [Flavobacterium frigoris]